MVRVTPYCQPSQGFEPHEFHGVKAACDMACGACRVTWRLSSRVVPFFFYFYNSTISDGNKLSEIAVKPSEIQVILTTLNYYYRWYFYLFRRPWPSKMVVFVTARQ